MNPDLVSYVISSILLVDDDDDLLATLAEYLTGAGYRVHTARDGHHALHVLNTIETPDLILLDYSMPRMNGREFLAARRRDPRLRVIPVIVLSAWTREWSGTRLGVADVLAKPIDPEKLLEIVARVLRFPPRPNVRSYKFERRRFVRLRLPETATRRIT